MQNVNNPPKGGGVSVWVAGLIAFVLIVIALSAGSSGQEKSRNSATRARAPIGEEGLLNNNGNRNDCEGLISIALSEEAFDDLTEASAARDNYGYQQVFSEGRAVSVENCTKVKVLDTKFAKKKVRVLSQPEIAGWVPAEWVLR